MCIAHYIAVVAEEGREEGNLDPTNNTRKIKQTNTKWIGYFGAQPWELGRWVKVLLWLTNSPHTPILTHTHAQTQANSTVNALLHVHTYISRRAKPHVHRSWLANCAYQWCGGTYCILGWRFGNRSKKIDVCDVYIGMPPIPRYQEVVTVHCATITCHQQ